MDVVTAEFWLVFFGPDKGKKKKLQRSKSRFLALLQFGGSGWTEQTESVGSLFLQGLDELSISLPGVGLDPGLIFSSGFIVSQKIPADIGKTYLPDNPGTSNWLKCCTNKERSEQVIVTL